MYRIDDEQRRIRIGRRHLLAPSARASSVVAVADAVVALHATDAATVYLSACARLTAPGVGAVEQALYEDVSLVRLLSMRNTLFTMSRAVAPVVDASNARLVAAKERQRLLTHLREDGNGLDERWLAEVERQTLAVLASRGRATGSELSAAVPALRTKITVFPGKKQETVQGVASRVIRVLAADGRIRRDRPRGSWTSSQFRWTVSEPWPASDPVQARVEVARRWLHAYGPATEGDLKWWTGWGIRETRNALAALAPEKALLDSGAVGWVLPDDLADEPSLEPWAALLPGLDPSAMGWADRGFQLPPDHRSALFDRAGNVGPTVWFNGQIVGGWAQGAGGEPVWRLLSDVGREASQLIATEAARMSAWIGDARITPRFRTPLERELSA
ncbi:winged helix DNA-binding domain-containing protein [Streptomyces sp. JH34]|uniref:winged helix DNA-binding domain-containing protein n=1 Tax=Streptomyces sp. JH34 TaxID=2793633 RepID=UPI0023F7CE76|nr:winged helix DNA-binding domain-containing protein [Streptomyces sp. JH34]MDF6019971.1 winged helix DNA-binding domain-containing protein [Streptomyces sp. JH34]